MATKKELILGITEAVGANPRAVFAGHGLNSKVLKVVAGRPDVIAKLAVFLMSTKMAKKGAAGLKKNAAFKIFGYPTFGDFNKNARTDVEVFMSGLSPEDSASFNNDENIFTIIALPDTKTGDTEADIVSGKSVAMEFGKAVKKEYKIPGGMYIAVMFGNSIIAPVEEKKAVVKEKVTKKRSEKKTPAKIKAILQRKAKSKLTAIANQKAKLDAKARKTSMQMQQYGQLAGKMGAQQGVNILDASRNYNAKIKSLMKTVNPSDRKIVKMASESFAKGDLKTAKVLLKGLENPQVAQFILSGAPRTADDVFAARKVELKKAIKALTVKNEELLVQMSLAPTAKQKAALKFAIKKNAEKINDLRDKLAAVSTPISKSELNKKAKMLADTNAAIANNIARGASIQQALNSAIAKLEATPEQKQQIKQQVIQQMADGTPAQYAVQQAIQAQDFPVEEDLYNEDEELDLAGSQSIEDILSVF